MNLLAVAHNYRVQDKEVLIMKVGITFSVVFLYSIMLCRAICVFLFFVTFYFSASDSTLPFDF
jgi:hypothetical protein